MTRIIPIFVPQMGCKHSCVYCDQRAITGASPDPDYRAFSEPPAKTIPNYAKDIVVPQNAASALSGAYVVSDIQTNVLNTIETALTITDEPQQLAFYGGTFTAIEPRLRRAYLEAAQPYIKSGRIAFLRISTHPLYIDGDILDELFEGGVRIIELGAQSMDDTVLRAAGRGHTAEDVERAAELVKQRGFDLALQQMTGLPLASVNSDIASAKRLASLEPSAARIYPTVVLRGTPLETLWRRGDYVAESVEEAVERAAQVLNVYTDAGIRVIRIGLHASEELERNVLAGGYHPRLGEMVRQAAKRLDNSTRT